MIRWKHLWGPEVQTPSYILSPLDSGPQNISLECPISFSPFLPFGTLGNTAGDGGVFLLHIVIIFAILDLLSGVLMMGCRNP